MEWVWFFHHILHWSMSKICFSLSNTRMFIMTVLKLSTWSEAVLVPGWVRSLLQTRLRAGMLWMAFWFILPILSHSNTLMTTYRIFPIFLCLSSLFPKFHSICLLSLKINHSWDLFFLTWYVPLPFFLSIACIYLDIFCLQISHKYVFCYQAL